MKNIIILGPSKSGKSTLAKKLFFLSGNHSILSLDYIRSGFKRVFPQLHINDRDSALGGSGMKDDFPLFVKSLLRNQFPETLFTIVEGDSIKFEKAVELFTSDDHIIVFIGRNKISEDELFNEIRKYDIPINEWTLKWDDDELKKQCKNYIKTSLENEKKCNENNIMYFDVSFKFEELDSIANTILLELNKSIKI